MAVGEGWGEVRLFFGGNELQIIIIMWSLIEEDV